MIEPADDIIFGVIPSERISAGMLAREATIAGGVSLPNTTIALFHCIIFGC